jgi:8-oxo-dGTP pyrophosphatase MutT (NUDIX family)
MPGKPSGGRKKAAKRVRSRKTAQGDRTVPIGVHPLTASFLPKHLVVTGYVVDSGRVLLLMHGKLKRWLPPGGHVESTEDPLRALVREIWEETGLLVAPIDMGDRSGSEEGVNVLPTPHHLQVETIDGKHEHIDMVYFCTRLDGTLKGNAESREVRWFSREDLGRFPLGKNVKHYAEIALVVASYPDALAGYPK